MFGLDLGAAGLAGKLVVVQWLSVGLQAAVIRHEVGWGLDAVYQALAISALAAGAFGSHLIARAALHAIGLGTIPVALFGCALYGASTFALIWQWPELVGASSMVSAWRLVAHTTRDVTLRRPAIAK
jgi:hypothetical protein